MASSLLSLLLSSSAVALDASVQAQFVGFMAKYNKSYSSKEEESLRLHIFSDNLGVAAGLNNNNARLGGKDDVFGVTQFSDLSRDEFKQMYLLADGFLQNYTGPRVNHPGPWPKQGTTAVDWRDKGAVSFVKNQGGCGSCWAFSVVQAIESFAEIDGQGLHGLSASQIVECDRGGNDRACNGGFPTSAMSYVMHAGGLMREADYPYRNDKGVVGACMFSASKVSAKIHSYNVATKGEHSLEHELTFGPPSIVVAADAWQHYTSGVMHSCPGQLNHAVQAVGVHTDAWIVKNQWGPGWGEHGYIRIAKGNDVCGLASTITYPVMRK